MKYLKRIAIVIVTIFGVYLGIGYLFHLVIFPEYKPDISNYFKQGDVFYSKAEGLKQTILKQEKGKVYCKIEIEPHADGPPLHIHTNFDEIFKGGDKPINIIVGTENKILNPGEEIVIPKGTPHKPYNESDSTVTLVMTDDAAFPQEFAVYLTQVYGYFDESKENMNPPKVIFQMAMFQQHLDSYLGEGPPLSIQKIQNFIIVPLARLLGFKSYYKKYEIKR